MWACEHGHRTAQLAANYAILPTAWKRNSNHDCPGVLIKRGKLPCTEPRDACVPKPPMCVERNRSPMATLEFSKESAATGEFCGRLIRDRLILRQGACSRQVESQLSIQSSGRSFAISWSSRGDLEVRDLKRRMHLLR